MNKPQAHGDFDGSIISYSFNISVFFLRDSDLCGVIHSPSSFPVRYRALLYLYLMFNKIASTYVGFVCKKTPEFRFNTSLRESSSLSIVLFSGALPQVALVYLLILCLSVLQGKLNWRIFLSNYPIFSLRFHRTHIFSSN